MEAKIKELENRLQQAEENIDALHGTIVQMLPALQQMARVLNNTNEAACNAWAAGISGGAIANFVAKSAGAQWSDVEKVIDLAFEEAKDQGLEPDRSELQLVFIDEDAMAGVSEDIRRAIMERMG